MMEKRGLQKVTIIAVAIIAASFILVVAINNGTRYIGDAIGNGLNSIGSSVASTGANQPFDDAYMSDYQASAFIKVNYDNFLIIVESGELSGTFTIIQDERVFSKEKLIQWLSNRIE